MPLSLAPEDAFQRFRALVTAGRLDATTYPGWALIRDTDTGMIIAFRRVDANAWSVLTSTATFRQRITSSMGRVGAGSI